MLNWALRENSTGPVMIRYPKAIVPPPDPVFTLPLEKGRGVLIQIGNRKSGLCIAFTGSLYNETLEAAELLELGDRGADLYNLRFIKPVDEDYLVFIMNNYELFVIAEEGISAGGFGEYAAELASRRNCTCQILCLGISGELDALGKRSRLLSRNSLDGRGIAAAVLKALSAAPQSATFTVTNAKPVQTVPEKAFH